MNDLSIPNSVLLKEIEDENNNIFVLHDGNGNILEILNKKRFSFSDVIDELLSIKNLGHFFQFPPILSPDVNVTALILDQKSPFRSYPEKGDFQTTLPVSHLKIFAIRDNLFLGRITFYNFIPNLISRNITGFIYIDMHNDTLLGYNYSFYQLFKDKYTQLQLLNRPMADFFSPTPREFQLASLPSFRIEQAQNFTTVYQKDFTREDFGPKEELLFCRRAQAQPNGFLWENTDSPHLFLTILETLDTGGWDFVVTLQFMNLIGKGPFFCAGDRYQESGGLDESGYLAGWAPFGNKVLLKKQTFVAAVADAPEIGAEKITTHFCKIGDSLFLFKDATPLIAYYDNDILNSQSAFITLGLRKGYRCVLKCLSLRMRKCPAEASNQNKSKSLIARLNNKGGRYFKLDRFYNFDLAHHRLMHASGFFLNDITEIQDKLSSLDHKYKIQLKRGEELRKLLIKQEMQNEEFIGSGEKITAIKNIADTVASSGATILIEGPTGSGKEVLAHYIHRNSDRKAGPFIKVDCSTVPQSLMESHLFGHEKGAFTGAIARNIGMFEKAEGGTLFLDEIANLNLLTQTKLLQFFNDFSIIRIGGAAPIRLNVRCIVAANEDLEAKIKEGTFREDLFYRINVVHLKVPPLKERLEDLPELCSYFLKLYGVLYNKEIKGISPEALQKLHDYEWPGNIREFRNALQRAVLFAKDETITPELISLSLAQKKKRPLKNKKERTLFHLSKTDKDHVLKLLDAYSGNVVKIAKALDIHRGTLYQYLKRENVDIDTFRKGFDSLP